ncbi:MAG: DUF4493 domain-containing protein [Muribaculaceae bacterium]|nr:DUF4493 domain-containing protein [Muribaculaceae bacterium]
MKSIYNILLCASLAGLLGACASEAPWEGPKDRGEGSFAKSALNLKVQTDHVIKQTRAGKEVEMDMVYVNFFDNKSGHLKDFYLYGQMPEVVALEEGDYYVTAVYTHDGTQEHRAAAWDYPFYQGKSDMFTIKPNQITTDLGTIKCALENVMTSVVFDPMLREHMSEEDSFVELKLKEGSDVLNFTVKEQDNENYGYFHIEGEQSLVATFKGKIDGAYTDEVKTVANVEAGNHYRITFKLHDYQGENSGNAAMDIMLDASVTTTDVDGNVSIEEAGIGDYDLGDNERPSENPEEPIIPDQPTAPLITSTGSIKLGEKHLYVPGEEVVLNIVSSTGIEVFEVDIVSPSLSPEELAQVGLAAHLDLVNPGELKEPLNNLGLLKGDSVKGEKEVKFDITNFMPLLAVLGDGVHTFNLTVGDADERITKESLIIEIKN